MHNILSEGRKIESRYQLNLSRHRIKIETRGKEFGNETGTPARERPVTRGTGALRTGLDLKLVRGKKKRLDSKDVD